MMISNAREIVSSPPATQPARHRPPPTPAKSNQPLHNFALPPLLKWGSKRTVRLEKPEPDDPEFTLRSFDNLFGHHPADSRRAFRRPLTPPKTLRSPYLPPPAPAPPAGGGGRGKRSSGDRGIEEIREKFLVHVHTAAKKMKFRVAEAVPVPASDAGTSAADEQSRPWNLRTRRSACHAPDDDDTRRRDVPSSSAPPPPPPPPPDTSTATATAVKSNRLRSMAAERDAGEKKERRKFAVVLFKDEIEEDIFAITGSRPARRPKKRPRNVQKDVDTCFPGLWLSEVTADTYKVSDFH